MQTYSFRVLRRKYCGGQETVTQGDLLTGKGVFITPNMLVHRSVRTKGWRVTLLPCTLVVCGVNWGDLPTMRQAIVYAKSLRRIFKKHGVELDRGYMDMMDAVRKADFTVEALKAFRRARC